MKAVISFLALSLSSLVLAQNPYLDAYQAVLARRWAEEATAQKAISLANDIESEEDKDELASPSHEESDDSRSQQDGLESSDGGKISDDDVKAILRYYATGKLLKEHAEKKARKARQKMMHSEESDEHAHNPLLRRSFLDMWAQNTVKGAQNLDHKGTSMVSLEHGAVSKVKDTGKAVNQGVKGVDHTVQNAAVEGVQGAGKAAQGAVNAERRVKQGVKDQKTHVKSKALDVERNTLKYIDKTSKKEKQKVGKLTQSATNRINKINVGAQDRLDKVDQTAKKDVEGVEKGLDSKPYKSKAADGLEREAGRLRGRDTRHLARPRVL